MKSVSYVSLLKAGNSQPHSSQRQQYLPAKPVTSDYLFPLFEIQESVAVNVLIAVYCYSLQYTNHYGWAPVSSAHQL